MAAAECPKCKTDMAAVQVARQVSVAGIVGGVLFVLGLVLLLAVPALGIGAMVVGVVVGLAGRGSTLRLQCPRCGTKA